MSLFHSCHCSVVSLLNPRINFFQFLRDLKNDGIVRVEKRKRWCRLRVRSTWAWSFCVFFSLLCKAWLAFRMNLLYHKYLAMQWQFARKFWEVLSPVFALRFQTLPTIPSTAFFIHPQSEHLNTRRTRYGYQHLVFTWSLRSSVVSYTPSCCLFQTPLTAHGPIKVHVPSR